MKYYTAGKFEDRQRVKELQEFLRKQGHEITVDWTEHNLTDLGYPKEYAIDDVLGVDGCDIFIGLFEKEFNYRGALVEFGMAIRAGCKLIIIGHAIDTCIFMSLPDIIQFDTLEEFKDYMEGKMT